MSAEKPPWWFERTTYHLPMFLYRFRKSTRSDAPYAFPDSVETQLRQRFAAIEDIESALRRFHVDYIWQGPYERDVGIDSLDNERNVEIAFENGRVRIYRVLNNEAFAPKTENTIR